MDAKHQLNIEAVLTVIAAVLSHPHRPGGAAPRAIESGDFLQLGRRQALSKCRNRAQWQQRRYESDDPSAAQSKRSWRCEPEQTIRNLPNFVPHTIPCSKSGSSRQEPFAGKTPLTALSREKSLSLRSLPSCDAP